MTRIPCLRSRATGIRLLTARLSFSSLSWGRLTVTSMESGGVGLWLRFMPITGSATFEIKRCSGWDTNPPSAWLTGGAGRSYRSTSSQGYPSSSRVVRNRNRLQPAHVVKFWGGLSYKELRICLILKRQVRMYGNLIVVKCHPFRASRPVLLGPLLQVRCGRSGGPPSLPSTSNSWSFPSATPAMNCA